MQTTCPESSCMHVTARVCRGACVCDPDCLKGIVGNERRAVTVILPLRTFFLLCVFDYGNAGIVCVCHLCMNPYVCMYVWKWAHAPVHNCHFPVLCVEAYLRFFSSNRSTLCFCLFFFSHVCPLFSAIPLFSLVRLSELKRLKVEGTEGWITRWNTLSCRPHQSGHPQR